MMFGGPPFMTVPGPIAIDSKNQIYVADFGQDGVHQYQLINTTAADSNPPPAAAAERPSENGAGGKAAP
jgi:hypothetical protein